MTLDEQHISVLKDEVIFYLSPKENGVYIDATFGAGGHSTAILANQPDARIICIDRDNSVHKNFNALKSNLPSANIVFINDKFGNLEAIVKNLNLIGKIDGIIFDFGVSSMQIDTPERGFSFQKDGDLSMEMGICKLSAADFINNASQEEIANVLYNYGGEKKSRKIAAAIEKYRSKKAITSTLQLADIVKEAVGFYKDSIHPATRTFQAIRIYVNDEIQEIKKALDALPKIAKEDMRCCCISFHSLEDSIVKNFITVNQKNYHHGEVFDKNYGTILTKQIQSPSNNSEFYIEKLHTGVITPSKQEIAQNIRSRSSKMRAFEFKK